MGELWGIFCELKFNIKSSIIYCVWQFNLYEWTQLKSFVVTLDQYLFYIVNILGADALATPGARASATLILTLLNGDNSIPSRQELRQVAFGLQCVSPTRKPIDQKDLWNFWFDKCLKVVMGPPCLVNNTEQIFPWTQRTHIDKIWSVLHAKYMEKLKDPWKKRQSLLPNQCRFFLSYLLIWFYI